MSPTSLVEWMDLNFPFFCRRVCHQCNPVGSTKLMLRECPVIKLDAYADLMREHSKNEVSKRLRSKVKELVTPNLVESLSKVRASTNIQVLQRPRP